MTTTATKSPKVQPFPYPPIQPKQSTNPNITLVQANKPQLLFLSDPRPRNPNIPFPTTPNAKDPSIEMPRQNDGFFFCLKIPSKRNIYLDASSTTSSSDPLIDAMYNQLKELEPESSPDAKQ